MEFNACIELTPEEIKEMIVTYFANKAICINNKDIMFRVHQQEKGSQMDPYTVYEFAGAKISNIKVGK
jgi:hypothetical protein